ncbi:hypothetical protein [Ferrimonas balearica]|nr:hypothetical protein [Ferrimonas balearica]
MLKIRHTVNKFFASYGHFGRVEFPWEQTDKAEALRADAGL